MVEQNELRQVRVHKLTELKKSGINPYPSISHRSHLASDIEQNFNKLFRAKKKVTVAGRLMSKREHGGLIFGDVKDVSGSFQVLFKKDELSAKNWGIISELIDIGDIVEVTGTLFVTQKGHHTLLTKQFNILTKSLLPLPEKWHGLVDTETRFRQRYLDLLMNDDIKQRFVIRHKLIQAIREFLIKEDYIEVDTPALQPMAGGALATPFKTRYEAINADVYLRIAPELYLKRLLIGGFEKVFEFARVFRNEGVSTQHLQDFTMLESYQAYTDYKELMKLMEKMLSSVVKKVLGTNKIKFGDKTIDFKTPWPVKSFRDLIIKETGIDIDKCLTVEELESAIRAKKIQLTYKGKAGRGKLIDELYKEQVRPKLINPIFLVDHPLDLSPLAKRKDDDPNKVQRFQLIICGMEVLNAFSELNDAQDQAERFKEQAKQKKAGDSEAHSMDDNFVKALEYGMPPAAGFGLGIDRLVALLTDADSIREAVLFPFVKDK